MPKPSKFISSNSISLSFVENRREAEMCFPASKSTVPNPRACFRSIAIIAKALLLFINNARFKTQKKKKKLLQRRLP
jgi:hypothetical protein